MSRPVTIALDAMGGDHGPEVVVAAAVRALADDGGMRLVLVGDEGVLRGLLARHRVPDAARLELRHASQQVAMDELPSRALRTKKDSSMRRAIDMVKAGEADAAVSAGNTGALMAIARFVLKTLPGVDRPAIITAIPAARGHTHVLDLGANVDCTSDQLFQFAVMGAVLAEAVDGIARPRVALLNIGEEEIKGNDSIKEAARLLEASTLNYVGFVEADDIFLGDADVVVCDGFTGNVALKASEGTAKLISRFLREAFARNPLTRLAGACAAPVLKALARRIDPRRYNGASFLGLNGTVIKSHGAADALAFANAIRIARVEVEKAVPERISARIESLLAERQAV
ncbi:MAG TPA: phosphate acyltransferase PlsX [Chromatiales bacterium]|nr:phosphate acyltransferase PlsX [Chromatiales bacterium]